MADLAAGHLDKRSTVRSQPLWQRMLQLTCSPTSHSAGLPDAGRRATGRQLRQSRDRSVLAAVEPADLDRGPRPGGGRHHRKEACNNEQSQSERLAGLNRTRDGSGNSRERKLSLDAKAADPGPAVKATRITVAVSRLEPPTVRQVPTYSHAQHRRFVGSRFDEQHRALGSGANHRLTTETP